MPDLPKDLFAGADDVIIVGTGNGRIALPVAGDDDAPRQWSCN